MTYIINKTDGSVLTTLNDGTVDTTTDIVLVGKNYSGYGEYQNENFVKLLENFKNTSAPVSPLEGQIWYDSVNKSLKVYNGSGFKLPPVATSSGTAPTNRNTGDLWYDSTNQQLNFWDGSNWKVIGPAYSASLGTTGDVYDTISDGVTAHPVIKKYLTGNLISVISKDSQFTPSPSVAGFSTVRPGYNISSNYKLTALNDLHVAGDAYVSGTVNGNATSASTIAVTDTPTTSGTYYVTFTSGTTGNQTLRTDSSTLTWDPSTNTLSCNVSGTITNATNVAVTNTATGTGPYYLTFVDGTSGNKGLRVDASTLTYNATTNTITADLSGNASTATSASTATTATTATNIAGGSAGSIPYQTGAGTTALLSPGSNGFVLTSTGTSIQWSSAGAASNVTVTDTNTGTHYLAFVSGTSGSQAVKVDSTTLTYNAGSDTINANLAGTATIATNIAGGSAGSLPYQTGSNTTALLSPGTNGFVLTSTGTGIQWSSSPAASNVTVTDTPTTNATYYVTFVDGTSGSRSVRTDSSTLTYNPSTNTLTSNFFSGTSTSAQYADLAERYEADAVYEPGTLVRIGGEKEITRTLDENDIDIFGVISTNPGFLLNSEAGNNNSHPPVALQGRVPVLVVGPVRKGQRLVSSNIPGVAKAVIGAPTTYAAVLGRALETSEDSGVRLINSVVGIK